MKPAASGSNSDDDDTVKIVPNRGPSLAKPARRSSGVLFASALAIGIGAGTAVWFLWPHTELAVVRPSATVPRPPEFRIETATEVAIRDNVAEGLTIFRLAANPNILILDFASLLEQGAMMNRLGAIAEKAGLPRDRVLNDAELRQAIQAAGDTAETYYYGHDYSAAEIVRFFALADRDRIVLNSQEESLRRLMRQEGWFADGKVGGLISVPKIGANAQVTADSRATILHHELSHGEYFSNPAFAAYVRRFWMSVVTQAERDAMRKYLAKEAYDTGLDTLMENEAQAYLVFTLNPAFFEPSTIGMTEGRRAELRTTFLRDMPTGWLRNSAPPRPETARAAVR
jgi:hypothetical protein